MPVRLQSRPLATLLALCALALPAVAQPRPSQPRKGLALTTPQRRALVIGNSSYPRQPLLNPGNDATDLAATLPDAGFNVTLRTDLDNKALERAVIDFSETVQPGDTALFFFSGHGLEVEGGQNYLLPLDFTAKAEADVKYQALAASRVQELLQARKPQTVILILDACRNNPYKSWSRAAGGGLAGMSGESVYIAFAAAAGKQADDNPGGRNGIFTKHLLANLRAPGLPIDEVFNRVRRGVVVDTKGTQVPFSNSGLIDPFVFIDPVEERAKLEREIQDFETRAADAQRRKDQQQQADLTRQAAAARERLKLQPSAAPTTAPTSPAVDLEALRKRRDAEQARLASLATGMPPTLEEARAEVASLEKKAEGLRAEIYGLRDAALRGQGVARDPFETTAQYEARQRQQEAELAKLAGQYEDQLSREVTPYRARINTLMAATYPMRASTRVEWKTYDADRSLLVVAINGVDSRFTISPATARNLYERRSLLTAETTWEGAAALVDPETRNHFQGQPAPWINPKDGLEYVRIAPGSFLMGCSPGDSECPNDEKPAHRVTLTKGFRMGVTAVTQEAWQRVMRTNPSQFKGAKLPVEQVDFTQAQNYCATVGMRLPTEAEWEYAARAGTTGARYGNLDTIAWYDDNSGRKTHEVGQKQPNAWGLYDMLGNVWQWTGDWYADEYQGGNQTDPKGPASGQDRTLRGGSWNFEALGARASIRIRLEPTDRNNNLGFRCVGE